MEAKPSFTFSDYWRLYETAGEMGIKPLAEHKIGDLHRKTVGGARRQVNGSEYLESCGFEPTAAKEVADRFKTTLELLQSLAVGTTVNPGNRYN